jgi:ribosome biogenesis GTPase
MTDRADDAHRVWGFTDRWAAQAETRPDLAPGRVVRHDGTALLVATAREVSHRHVRRQAEDVTVGDWVLTDGDVVEVVLPRTSFLRRRDPGGGGQALAANVDVVAVVCGLDRPLRLGRIRRTVALSWDAGATPVVVLTKTDLVEPSEAESEIRADDPMLDVVSVSAPTGAGIDLLQRRIGQGTVVLLGESGAGKSTLTNAIAGYHVATTGEVRTGDHKGRHITTARMLHPLPGGGCLIDTPGIREVGLWTDTGTIDRGFDDIEALAAGCRFRDCRHDTEPGCAVRAAADRGGLEPERLTAWRELRAEAESAELRADEAARRRADRRFGRMARQAKRVKRVRRDR